MRKLRGISIGLPKLIEPTAASSPTERAARPWRTAIFKQPVAGPIWVGREGLIGDGQANRKYHGGPERALLMYSAEHYPIWREELGRPELDCGWFGENLTVDGFTEETVRLEQRLAIGEVIVQVASARQPCTTLARRLGNKDIIKRVRQTARSGWYCRVLKEGTIEVGLAVELLSEPGERWGPTVATALRQDADD